MEEDDFALVPWSFRYGNSQEQRWLISPPPPPTTPNPNPPPPRTFRSMHVVIRVAADHGVQQVEVVRTHGENSWHILLNRALPVRSFPTLVSLNGNSPTEYWLLSAEVRPWAQEEFIGGQSLFVVGTPANAEYESLLSHWDDIVGGLTPNEEDADLVPAPPPESTIPENTPVPTLTP